MITPEELKAMDVDLRIYCYHHDADLDIAEHMERLIAEVQRLQIELDRLNGLYTGR
jgi:hypothetical protein